MMMSTVKSFHDETFDSQAVSALLHLQRTAAISTENLHPPTPITLTVNGGPENNYLTQMQSVRVFFKTFLNEYPDLTCCYFGDRAKCQASSYVCKLAISDNVVFVGGLLLFFFEKFRAVPGLLIAVNFEGNNSQG